VWLATSITAAVILWFFPHILIRPTLSVTTVTIAAALSSLLTLVQCLQSPMSVLTQARGAFRPLAATSVRSCLVGIAAVLALTFTVPPVYTVAGVVLSQLVMMLGIVRLERRLRPAAAEMAR
jgi:cyanate permease